MISLYEIQDNGYRILDAGLRIQDSAMQKLFCVIHHSSFIINSVFLCAYFVFLCDQKI